MVNDNQQDWQYWYERRNKIISKRGGWQIGIGVHNCGYDQMKELVAKKDYFQVLVLNSTGKLPSTEFAKWLGALFICLSWPDPRIWCNTMGALSGSLKGRITSGVASGILSSDSSMFGGSEVLNICSSFIQSALKERKTGKSVETIIVEGLQKRAKMMRKPVIPGFARPLATGDERVPTMVAYARELGFSVGPHEQLAMDIHDYLMSTQNESINIGGYCAGFMSDQGFNPTELKQLLTTLVNSGVHACHVEEEQNPPLSFMPMACKDIDYRGPAKRKV